MKAVRCTAKSSYTAAKLLAAAAISCAALCASAAKYYWKGEAQGLWTTASNWSTVGAGGEDATDYPRESDVLDNNIDFDVDLGSGVFTITGWGSEAGGWDHRTWTIRNGSLTITGETRTHAGDINIESGGVLIFPSGSTFYPGVDVDTPMNVNVKDGGALSVLGTARFYRSVYNVAAGGALTFSPTSIRTTSSKANEINNRGTLNLPNGMVLGQYDSGSSAMVTLNQIDGTLNLGGSIDDTNASNPSTFNVVFSGGTVNVTGDATFNVTSVSLENSVTFNVDSGKTVNLSPVDFASGSSIVKTGEGAVILPVTALTATISAGKLALSAATYDLAAVTFGSDAIIDLTAMGARIDSAGASIESATFAATIPATAGTDVLYSTNPTILQYAKADLDASVPAGFDLVISGEALSVEAETAGSFTGNGDICDAEGWGGTIPAAGSDVSIDGADAIATYSGGDMPAWNSIEVKNGATLRIASNLTLPKIILNKNAKLEIVNSASVTLGNVADLTGVVAATPELVIPELVVEAGATLNVPGGMKFSNVNIDLKGTMAVSPAGTITFGYAAAGETTYIGFNSVGGKITNGVVWGYDGCRIEICCPKQGGTVIAPESIVFKDMPVIGEYLPTNSDNYWNGFSLGVNNPESVSFNVVFDNTKWNASGNLYVKGGATFWLKNDSVYMNDETYSLYNRHAEVSGNGCIIIESGSELRIDAMGNSGDTPAVFNASVMGHESVIVADGGIYDNYRTTGNGNGVFAASNAVITVHVPIIDEDVTGSSGTKHYCNTNVVFEGFSSVSLATNSTMTITTRNSSSSYSRFTDNSGDRVVSLADVPITGEGSIALDNANVNKFGVIVTSGSNTATGSASVVAPGEGEGETTLYFADGANWAGTVTAGNVALTNLVDSAAACTNTFGTLALAAGTTFPIRVRKTGGVIVAHDGLNVGSYANNGGKIVLVAMDEELAPGDSFILGMVVDDSTPAVGGKWEARAENGVLKVKYSSGLTVILR